VVFAPLLETLAFPLVHWMLSSFPWMRVLFVPTMSTLAYFVHGGGPLNFAQAAGFAVFAVYYDRLKRARTQPPAYWGAAIALSVYNATLLALMILVLIGSLTFPDFGTG
jgi:hypothetical protein